MGITPEGSLGMKMAGLGGEAALRGAGGVHGEKDTVKTCQVGCQLPHLNSGFCSCFAFIPHSGPILEGSESLIHKQDFASLMLSSSLQLAQKASASSDKPF